MFEYQCGKLTHITYTYKAWSKFLDQELPTKVKVKQQ